MNKLTSIVLMLLGFTVIGSAQDVAFNFDQSADFTKFKTYRWIQIPGQSTQLDDLTARQLTSALETELAKKGLIKTDNDSADLSIGYHVATSQEKQLTAYNSGWGYGPYWGGGTGVTTTSVSTLTIGSLALDMYNTSKKELVWRGTATKTLDLNAKPDKRLKNIQKGAEKILKNYPPKKK